MVFLFNPILRDMCFIFLRNMFGPWPAHDQSLSEQCLGLLHSWWGPQITSLEAAFHPSTERCFFIFALNCGDPSRLANQSKPYSVRVCAKRQIPEPTGFPIQVFWIKNAAPWGPCGPAGMPGAAGGTGARAGLMPGSLPTSPTP